MPLRVIQQHVYLAGVRCFTIVHAVVSLKAGIVQDYLITPAAATAPSQKKTPLPPVVVSTTDQNAQPKCNAKCIGAKVAASVRKRLANLP
jgi:hypothetical protein